MHAMLRPLPLALAVAEKAFREFSNQWLAGLQPQLSLETSKDGQIWFNSRVAAGDVPTRAVVDRHHAADEASGRCQAGQAVQHPRPRRRGPSYQRRLLRRASARAAAETADEAVQTAVETVEQPAGEAVQADPPSQVAAEVLPAPAQPHQENFWSLLRDELCPDMDFDAAVQGVLPCHPPPHQSCGSSPHIPQVDGNTTLQDQDQERNICGGINMKVFHDIEAAREKRFREMEAETEKLMKMMQKPKHV